MAEYTGYISVARAEEGGWLMLRADLGSADVVRALASAGVPVPAPRRIEGCPWPPAQAPRPAKGAGSSPARRLGLGSGRAAQAPGPDEPAGIPLPLQAAPDPGAMATTWPLRSFWMAPDELLLWLPIAGRALLAERMTEALGAAPHLLLDVSDMRQRFTLTGAAVREVLAKLTPADVAILPQGELRRSRLGQVAAAFWLEGDLRAEVLVARSVADYAFTLLRHAARPGGEVG